jgi:hypothetical protein
LSIIATENATHRSTAINAEMTQFIGALQELGTAGPNNRVSSGTLYVSSRQLRT